jgi:hypothetical protein
MRKINSTLTITLDEYIKQLKSKIYKIQNEIPEFWMHEDLREIQVLYRTINELKDIIKDYYKKWSEAYEEPVEYDATDPEMDEIKEWLKSHMRAV